MAEKNKLMEDEQNCPDDPEKKDPQSLNQHVEFCLCLMCFEKFRLWELYRKGGDGEEEECEELRNLRAEKQSYEDLEKTYVEMEQLCEDQATRCELQIREEFCRLHTFLQEQEERVLTALREEKLMKTKNISLELQEVREKLRSLNNNIEELKEHLQTDKPQPESPVNHSQTKTTSLQDQKPHPWPKAAWDKEQRPRLRPKAGLLLDQARVLGNLGFRVWRNMRRTVSYSPVILDPNTAHGGVVLSQDLRGFRGLGDGESKQKLPDNLERFSVYTTVLGCDGFSSGTHQWDVEVGDHPAWIIGVIRESAERKEHRSVSPGEGVWCLFHQFDTYFNGNGRRVPVQTPPQRLRVKLDYDRGKVYFYDADHMTHLYTHSGRFTEALFPFFTLNNMKPNNAEIRILPCEPDKDTLCKTSPGTKLLEVFKSVTGMFRH